MLSVNRDKKSQAENRGEMARSLVTTGRIATIGRMATTGRMAKLQLLLFLAVGGIGNLER